VADDVAAGAAPPVPPGELGPDERTELERLRAEVARLRDAAAGSPSRAARSRSWRGRGRGTAAALLIVLAVVLAPLSVVSVWARGVVTDTDRYVETVAPLADDPALQQAVADDLTDLVFRYVDVQGLTTQALAALAERGSLPPALADQLTALAVPLANGARRFAEDQVLTVVQSDVFARAWVEANRAAHEQLVAALTGEGSTLRVRGDAVVVDLGAFLAVARDRLVSQGFGLAARIPAVRAEVVVFRSADVVRLQRTFRVLDALGFWLPLVCVALVGAGVLLSRNRRTAFLAAGAGLAVAMLVTGLGLAAARTAYLAGVPADELPPDAAAALYDTLVRFLRDGVRAAFLIGVLVAAIAVLAGPSRAAVVVRRGGAGLLGTAKGGLADLGLDLAPVTRVVAPRVAWLRATVLAVAAVALLLQRYRTPEIVGEVALYVGAALLVVEFLAAEPRRRGHSARVRAAEAETPGVTA
jgi:hypothetical protein